MFYTSSHALAWRLSQTCAREQGGHGQADRFFSIDASNCSERYHHFTLLSSFFFLILFIYLFVYFLMPLITRINHDDLPFKILMQKIDIS